MAKNNKVFLNNRFVRWVIIPLCLFGLWLLITASYILIHDKSFFILSYNHPKESFQQVPHDRLTKGNKLTGSFIAQANNLGIVSIRFEQFFRIPYKDEDIVVFRIKEKGAKEWYAQNKYRSGLLSDNPFLPFGFIPIANSQGKKYVFELESLRGNNKNGFFLSQRQPNLSSKYTLTKASLLKNDWNVFSFIYKKTITSLFTIDILILTIIYAIPIYLYGFHKKRFGLYQYIFILILIWETTFLQIANDLLYVFCMIIWITLLRFQEDKARYTFYAGFLFFVLTFLFTISNNISASLDASSWTFVFFVTGTLQSIFQAKFLNKKIKRKGKNNT